MQNLMMAEKGPWGHTAAKSQREAAICADPLSEMSALHALNGLVDVLQLTHLVELVEYWLKLIRVQLVV